MSSNHGNNLISTSPIATRNNREITVMRSLSLNDRDYPTINNHPAQGVSMPRGSRNITLGDGDIWTCESREITESMYSIAVIGSGDCLSAPFYRHVVDTGPPPAYHTLRF